MAVCLVVLAGFIALPASANIAVVANPEGDSQDLMIISSKAGLRNAPVFPADERIFFCYDVLISESKTRDLIFELGETLAFIIQDYTNSLAPLLFGSLGVGSGSVDSGGITT